MYVLMRCPQAYKRVADADRKGFLQNYARHGIKDLKWVAYYSKKSEGGRRRRFFHSRNDDIVTCPRYILRCFKIYFCLIQNESDAKAENFRPEWLEGGRCA